ncbi:hypothetical protein FV228_32585, partial [Methylobacterium sp. WL18]
AVTNAATGAIATWGDGSHGILAQSIGGGGGTGGSIAAREDSDPDTVGTLWKQIKQTIGVTAYETWAKDKSNKENKQALDQFLKDIKTSDTYKDLADTLKNSDFGKALKSYSGSVSRYLDAQKKGAAKLPDVSATLALGGDGAQGGSGAAVSVENAGT